ncbi:MAG: PHP domain-containing protein [Victivallaceae bacterium]|nr:PHP domain-containing protein [Victivallaceae bacterium]
MKLNTIDLHSHSTYSDGTLTPEELLCAARKIGLQALALTDHDTVAGIPDFLQAAVRYPEVAAIPGVEISTLCSGRELHIIGLFLDHENPGLLDFLNDLQLKRRRRNERLAEKLAALGYAADLEAVSKQAKGKIIGRPHFAEHLLKNYDFANAREVFDKLLKRDAPAYVGRPLPFPEAAIEVIRRAGGIAVWAHPIYRRSKERSWCRRILRRLVPAGLDAIEAYYPQFDESQTRIIRELAAEFGIALAGGSDYHGAHQPDISLGTGYGELRVPAEILPELQRRRGDKIREN